MKEYKYFLDTNIFLRPIVRDNMTQAEECGRLFDQLKAGKLEAITSSLVLSEMAWTTSSFYKMKRSEVVMALKGIVCMSNLDICDKSDVGLAVSVVDSRNVKFIDAMIYASLPVQTGEAVIVSYDKDFDKLDTRRLEPSEVLKTIK